MSPRRHIMDCCSNISTRMLLCSLIVIAMTINNLNAQTVCKRYGGDDVDFGFQLIEDPAGNYVMSGRSYSFGTSTMPVWADLYTIKLSPSFDIIWTSIFHTQTQDEGYSITNAHVDGYVATGASLRQGNGYDITVVKLDQGGQLLWSRILSTPLDERAQVIVPVSGNQYVIGGYGDSAFSSFIHGFVPFIVRLDGNGSVVWARRFGFSSGVFSGSVYDILEAPDSTLLVTGDIIRMDSGPGDSDIFLARFSAGGNLLWFQWMGTKCPGCQDQGAKLIQDHPNRYTLVASSSPTGSIYIRSFDLNGNLLLESGIQTGTFAFTKLDAVKTGPNSTMIACPAYNSILVVSIDTLHQVQWSNTYGEGLGEFPASILKRGNGLVVGGTSGNAGPFMNDYFIIEIDSTGHSCCLLNTIPLTSTSMQLPDSTGGMAHPFTLTEHSGGESTEGGEQRLVCEDPNTVIELAPSLISVYPNPFTSRIIIEFADHKTHHVQVISMSGQLVFEATAIDKHHISTDTWPAGVYSLLIDGVYAKSVVRVR
jgi:hypothetical protein